MVEEENNLQMPIKKLCYETKTVTNEEKTSKESFICELNDDCLLNIFKYLPAEDRINAERGNFNNIY